MKPNWPIRKLGAVADLCLGKMLDQKRNKGDYHPYIGNIHVRWGTFDLDDLPQMRFESHERDRYGLKHGDLVVCEGGEPGRCALWKDQVPNMRFQKALHRVRPHPCLDSRYLLYWFLQAGKRNVLNQYCTGATIKHLPREKLALVEVDVPPLPVQHCIAAILSAYDDLIENNTRRIQNLERMAQALYREWFIHFRYPGSEPSTRLGGHPSPTGRRAGDEGVQHVKRIASPLGRIPQGWQSGTFSDIAKIVRSGINPAQFPDEQFSHYSIPAFDAGHMPRLERGETILSNKFLLEVDCVLLSKLNPRIPRVWLPRLSGAHRVIASTEFLALQPRLTFTLPFLFGLCSSDEFQSVFVGRALGTSTSHQRVKPEDLMRLPIILPSAKVVADFSEQLEPMLALVHAMRVKNTNLRRTRDLLLPKLISGALDVSKLEIETT